jgi:hypothetical protein
MLTICYSYRNSYIRGLIRNVGYKIESVYLPPEVWEETIDPVNSKKRKKNSPSFPVPVKLVGVKLFSKMKRRILHFMLFWQVCPYCIAYHVEKIVIVGILNIL